MKRPDDEEMIAFVELAAPGAPYSEIAEAARKRFGPERAWTAAEIRANWLRLHPPRRGSRSVIDLDPELRAFIEDRLGRAKIAEIVAACRNRFGRRAPSKSAVHRYDKRFRARIAHAARSEPGAAEDAP